ncbi:MAG: hypothetical protein ACRD4C_08525 [Candidatus Acidiferrales bacterium]
MRAQEKDCPVCHAKPVYAAKMPYCPRCGWQKKQAEAQLRLNLKIAPALFLLLLGVLFLLFYRGGGTHQNRVLIAVFLSFPVLAFVISYTITRRNLKKLLAQPAPSLQPPVAPADSAPGAPASSLPQYEELLNTSPPRRVRMTRRGKFNLSLILIILFVFLSIMLVALVRAWSAAHSFAGFRTREWGMAGFATVLLLILLTQWHTLARERGLLESGAVVPGKVLQKWSGRSASTVSYEFQDDSGQKHRGAGMDYTRKIDEGMTVPVFYDRRNPKRQVIACATYHEVILNETPPAAIS